MTNKYERIRSRPRPEPIKPRMDLINRANIFAAFDALRGFDFSIREEEFKKELTVKEDISPDQEYENEWKLRMLRPGDKFTVTWFVPERKQGTTELGRYTTETVIFSGLDALEKLLVVNRHFIPYDNIREIHGDIFEREETA